MATSPTKQSHLFPTSPTGAQSHLLKVEPTSSPSNHSRSSNTTTSENDEPNLHDSKSTNAFNKCKRKINFPTFPPPNKHQPATVARRNARERNRVKQVNNGFASLKQHIPPEHRAKKMSKVETLRCAVDYIRRLQVALDISRMSSDSQGPKEEGSAKSVFGSMDYAPYGSSTNEQLSLSPTSSDDPGDKRSYVNSSLNQGTGAESSGLYDYDYDGVTSGDEDELLDAISIWQQS